MEKSENQIILIDKPAGISSFGAVAKVRGKLKAEFEHKVKVGHTGTLDPFATGLLILLSGKMTKKADEFLKKDKVYEAELKLGFISSTGDPEGEIMPFSVAEDYSATEKIPDLTEVKKVLGMFTGRISQTVPKYSAVKIDGQRAYKLARAGKDFTPPTREVEIYNIEILDYDYPKLSIRTFVSSGTYIRTLAEDIGKVLGTGAYLTALRRIEIGDFSVKDAEELDLFLS